MCRNQTGRINDITDKTELWWTKMMYRISGKLEAASALNLLKTHNTLRRRFCNQRIVLSLSLLSGALNKWDLLYVMTDEIHCMFSVVVTENISVLRISKFSWKYLGHQSHVSVRDPSQHPSPHSSMTCSVQHNAKSQHRSCIPHTINWISNRKTDKSANTHHFTRHLWLSEWTDGYISPRKIRKSDKKTKKNNIIMDQQETSNIRPENQVCMLYSSQIHRILTVLGRARTKIYYSSGRITGGLRGTRPS